MKPFILLGSTSAQMLAIRHALFARSLGSAVPKPEVNNYGLLRQLHGCGFGSYLVDWL